ncbi:MAG: phenylacetate--CoA ligase family protein, partial [Pirellulales bacterium]
MTRSTYDERRRLESLDAEARQRHQLARLNELLQRILPHNQFYSQRLHDLRRPIESLEELTELPYTFKEGLLGSRQAGEAAANCTYPLDRYVRFHQTSGTRGRPLTVLDTADDWQWWIDCWQYVLDAAEVTSSDRVMMAFSFGPFIGFWSAYDAASSRGCLMIPGGGMNTLSRIELLRASQATVVCCTPSYALHMAELAAQRQIDV